MDFPAGVMVTVRSNTTTRDDYGDATVTTVTRQWGPCAVAPRYAGSRLASTEGTVSTEPNVIVGMTVYGPTTALDSDDQIVIDGVTYEVVGIPGEWRSPFTGWAPGMEVSVVRASEV